MVELPDELIERLIAYLDDPEDPNGVWRGLHFMEASGSDPSVRHEEPDSEHLALLDGVVRR